MPVQTKEPLVIEDTMWAIEKSAQTLEKVVEIHEVRY